MHPSCFGVSSAEFYSTFHVLHFCGDLLVFCKKTVLHFLHLKKISMCGLNKDQVPELLKLSVFSISLSFELLSLLFHFLIVLFVCYFLISFKYKESSQVNFKCFFFSCPNVPFKLRFVALTTEVTLSACFLLD